MDRTIKITILAVLLALAPLAIAFAEPSSLPGIQPSDAVVKDAVNSAPRAVFPETKYEFATVFEGTEIKHDFVVENRGAAPLIINKIRPD